MGGSVRCGLACLAHHHPLSADTVLASSRLTVILVEWKHKQARKTEEKEKGDSKGEENRDRPAPHVEARKLMFISSYCLPGAIMI